MAFSKVFKSSNIVICNKFNRNICIRNNKNGLKSTYIFEVPIAGAFIHSTSYQYSTALHLKQHSLSKLASSSNLPNLSFVSFMSTERSNENFHVVVTNPNNDLSVASLVQNSSTSGNEVVKDSISVANENPISFADISDTTTSLSADLQSVVEPTLSSLGLAHWTPVGLIQMLLEYLHLSHHMPWWLAIVSCTVVARILLIPLLIKTQKNAIQMSNHMPQLQYLQAKFGEARRRGNGIEASRYASEIMTFMKEHNISPLKNAMLPMLQAPVFLSFFLGLRAMAKTPVESMKDGGIMWATDLTIPDPYFILPLVSCGTLYVVLKVGAESGVRMENLKLAKYFLQALPVLAFPFCINFPSAVLYYWCTNNFCTLAIVSILKIKPVREYLNMPTQRPIDPKFVLPKKGFVSGVKEAFEDQKILAAVEDRRRMDEVRFQKAGTGPIPRTYSYDPTKPKPANVASIVNRNMSAKERKM